MELTDFPEANVTIGRNKKDPRQEGNTYDAKVFQGFKNGKNNKPDPNQPCMVVGWKIDDKDRQRLINDKDTKVWLMITGHALMPHHLQTENPFHETGENYPDFVELIEMPKPTPVEIDRPMFKAVWSVIKTWKIFAPEYYAGYTEANASHVKIIMDAYEGFLLDQFKRIKDEPFVLLDEQDEINIRSLITHVFLAALSAGATSYTMDTQQHFVDWYKRLLGGEEVSKQSAKVIELETEHLHLEKLNRDFLASDEAKQIRDEVQKAKYSWFNNEEGGYSVKHNEGDEETMIAYTDTAEKADYITKACNYFKQSNYGENQSATAKQIDLIEMMESLENQFLEFVITVTGKSKEILVKEFDNYNKEMGF